MSQNACDDPTISTFPISRLPNELLDCVLLEVCQDSHDYVDVPPLSHVDSAHQHPRYSALAISWVCARWRAIALANPACWRHAAIDIRLPAIEEVADEPTEHRRIVAQSIALLRCYFERSKDAPLEIHFSEYLNDEDRWEATVGEVVRFACTTMPRWKTCWLPSYLVDWLSKDPAQLGSPLQLRSAIVYFQPVYDDFAVDLFARAPRLHRLAGPFSDRTAGVLPWAQLTHLGVSRFVSIQFFMSIVLQSQRLVKMDVQIWSNPNEPFPNHDANTAPVVLPNLESADFVVDAGAVLQHLLASLTTPKLLSLRLRGSARRGDDEEQFSGYIRLQRWPMHHFDNWLQRSRCDRLTTLILADIIMPQDDLIGIMERLPRLTEFGLKEHMALQPPERQHDLPVDNCLLRRLTAVDGAKAELFPELRSFIVKGILRFDWPLLLDMVRSRVVPRIENLDIYIDDQSTSDIDRDTEAGLNQILGPRGFKNRCGSKWDLEKPWMQELLANLKIAEQRAQEMEAQDAAAQGSVM